jgi:hypothetical protein
VNITIQDSWADASDKDETSDVEDEETNRQLKGQWQRPHNLPEKPDETEPEFDLTSLEEKECLEFRQGLFRCTKVLLTTVQLQV